MAVEMRHSIRFRVTALATAVIAVVLVATSVALVTLQSRQLTAAIDDSLRAEANALVAGADPDPARLLSVETVAQVVAVDGTVLASTQALAEMEPIAPAPLGIEAVTVQSLPTDDDSFRVLSRRIPVESGELVIHVGISAEDVADSTRALIVATAVLVPVVIVLLAGVVWWMVGRTLQPVERIRQEVATMSGDKGRRVSQPATDDEIGLLARTMNEMLDRIDTAIERQRRFVADASHELRTPLTRIRTEIEVAAAETPTPDPVFDSVLQETISLQRLVDDLLLLARADAGVVQAGTNPVDLDDLALAAAVHLRQRRQVEVDTAGIAASQASGDASQLRRVVANLVENAERHARRRVWLRTFEDDGMAYLVVGNDGPPIEPGQFAVLFERFGRIDEARSSEHGGAGLGLAIVEEIVARHHGSVTVESSDAATEFIVALPS